MAWFELRNSNVSTTISGPATISVLDLAGHESNRSLSVRSTSLPGRNLYGFAISNFPRREKRLTLRFLEFNQQKFVPLAEFKVINPARGTFPSWSPEAFPVERQDDNVVFALTGFNTGLYGTGLVLRRHVTWTEALFRVGTNEMPFLGTNSQQLGNWSIKQIELRDATGNFVRDEAPLGRIVRQTASEYMARIDDGAVNV